MKFYIVAERVSLDGYAEQMTVGFDNRATDDFDNAMFFSTKEQAEEWTTSKKAAEWKDCRFEVCSDN